MIDIKLLREDPDPYRENMRRKGRDDLDIIERALELDGSWRAIKKQVDDLRSERNRLSQEVNKAKKAGDDERFKHILAEVKALPAHLKEVEEQQAQLREELDAVVRKIPNLMHPDVPQGTSDEDNVEVSRHGPDPVKRDVRPHQEVAESLGMADFQSSAETSGAGFYYLQGDLALLNQALLRYAIEVMVDEGFTYVETPLMLREEVISRVTDVHDRENMIYKLEGEDLYLIGTSEHSMIGRYLNQSFDAKDLPILQTGYSMCFRREKGSHGLDERGLFRTHQFNKVEMVVFCHPDESVAYFKRMRDITVRIFTDLGLPTRVLQICTGDLGDLKHDMVDIEVYSPRRDDWIEVGSCSNLTDAQARSLGIRVTQPEKFVPHTLNNTAMATSRALVAILENNQHDDGTVDIPKVLQKYMFGKKKLTR